MGLYREKSSGNGFRKRRRGDSKNDFLDTKNNRGAIREGMHTFSSKIQREKEGDEDSSYIAMEHNKDDKGKKGRREPSIYTQNRILMCI